MGEKLIRFFVFAKYTTEESGAKLLQDNANHSAFTECEETQIKGTICAFFASFECYYFTQEKYIL